MSTASTYGIDVLAFGPHPDDVELFCGGVMIRLHELGYATGVVDLTRGELASRGTVEERGRESAAASEVLGLRIRENLGLPDGFLDASPRSPHLEPAVAALRRLRPELVLLPWIEERHPDHAAAGVLLSRAVFFAGLRNYETSAKDERFAPRRMLYYAMRHRMPPSFVVDTSSAWPRKQRAVACYASQVAARAGEPATLIGSALALAAIEARDRYYGSMIGASFGEALRSAGALGIVDPLALFRANPLGEAHAFEPLR